MFGSGFVTLLYLRSGLGAVPLYYSSIERTVSGILFREINRLEHTTLYKTTLEIFVLGSFTNWLFIQLIVIRARESAPLY